MKEFNFDLRLLPKQNYSDVTFGGVFTRAVREMSADSAQCLRCGRVRHVITNRPPNPLCRDCKGVLTPEQRKEWE